MLKVLSFTLLFIVVYLALLTFMFCFGGTAFWLLAWAVPSVDIWFNQQIGLTPFVAGGLIAIVAGFFSSGVKSNGK